MAKGTTWCSKGQVSLYIWTQAKVIVNMHVLTLSVVTGCSLLETQTKPRDLDCLELV
jgi:hypothetical protein